MPRMWIDTSAALLLAAGGSLHKSLMTDFTRQQTRLQQMTLLRTVIGIDIGRLVHDSGEGSEMTSLGIGVASQEAFTAGVTSLPDPNIDADFPTRGWIWRARYRTYGFAADQPAVFNVRVDLDLRSQRKLENGEAFFIGHNELVNGTTSVVQVTGLIRQLWLVS